MLRTRMLVFAIVGCLVGSAHQAPAQDPIEIFDAHLHYNWEPTPYLQPAEVIALFKKTRVTGILATSRPNVGTNVLVDAKPDGLWIVPFIRPYRVRADITSWMGDPSIFELVKEELKRGGYRGIGEFHLSGKAASNAWVGRIVEFAVENPCSSTVIAMRKRWKFSTHTMPGHASSGPIRAFLSTPIAWRVFCRPIPSFGASCPIAAASSMARVS